jgi:sodium transport system ATP-binding protein
VIEVEGLTKQLGDACVLDELSFVAPTGQITGLLGPNGAGKSTTMRVLSTLLRPTSGTARIAGVDVVADPAGVRRVIGLVTEEPGLYDRLTVREHLEFFARAQGLGPQACTERIDLVVTMLRLDAEIDKRAGTLSKGNRQKVSLARAIIHDPPVLLLDEPTSGLDVMATAGLEDLLAAEEVTGDKTVLLSTHRLDEAERLSDRIVGIVDGRVVTEGQPADLASEAGVESFRDAFVRLLGGHGRERGPESAGGARPDTAG